MGFVCRGHTESKNGAKFKCEPIFREECQAAVQHQAECRAFQSVGHREGRDLSMSLFNDIPFLNEVVIVLRSVNCQ